MKTDDLIAMLSTHVEPVDRNKVTRSIAIAVAFGAAAAVAVVAVGFGVRSDLGEDGSFVFLAAKLVFSLGIVALSSMYLTRLARPGGERKTSLLIVVLPFIAIMAMAAGALSMAPWSHWDDEVMGQQWVECLISIPLIAVVPFAVTMWAVRQQMPTDLRKAGALAGLVAGGLSATGYALHCMDDSVPFVAIWYGATIALCAAAGALLGPKLLRW
ncbi:NrsF family protein [Rhodoplanes roseus]|uniref:DUF1109 domain-containing protein n=1 Tax=Rhodoplanes roseus TaxID=29409 RepID=A0A327L347_9BRAD|nr:DUF1109 domain-containing protein [Rhodoplanes roseus]RAI44807.1 hypothetical protein CH341_07225 [Rhodoplanes roseus]